MPVKLTGNPMLPTPDSLARMNHAPSRGQFFTALLVAGACALPLSPSLACTQGVDFGLAAEPRRSRHGPTPTAWMTAE